MIDIATVTVPEDTTLSHALHIIDKGGLQIALVIDAQGTLKGILTDGDVRRALLRGVTLGASVSDVMNARPIVLREGEAPGRRTEQARLLGLRHLPVVDGLGRLAGLNLLGQEQVAGVAPEFALLMAGGLGMRLRPLTQAAPKPLLPVGGKPILEHVLCHFKEQGVKRFHISVNYKGQMIKQHFGDGRAWGVEIRYIDEIGRLGTAGALGLLAEPPEVPFIVANGDVLTTVNLAQMADFHAESAAMLTVGAFAHEYQVPYGVLQMENERIVKIEEKPVIRKYVSGGVYLLAPEVLAYVHAGEPLDMPDFIQLLVDHRRRVVAFPIREYWLDVGQPDDLKRASAEIEYMSQNSVRPDASQ
ncbi:MAG: nucleotidyltransferase family protein [Alphaproteobacteria bacterium]